VKECHHEAAIRCDRLAGKTEEEALANLKEALELHFEPPQATHPPKVKTISGTQWGSRLRESSYFEKAASKTQASAETGLGTAGKSACATLDIDALRFS
jgi:hypothetical protein